MGKDIPDTVKEILLEDIADNGDIMHACSGEPANYAGIAAVSLGSVALTEGDGNGDYTLGDGDVSGRKLTVALQTITPTGDGNVTHIVIADSVAMVLKAVTTCTSFAVLTGVDFNIASFDICEVSDAA